MLTRRRFLALGGAALVLAACDPMTVARRLLMGGGGAFPAPRIYPPADDSWSRSAHNPIIVGSQAWEQSAGLGWVLEPTVLYESGTFKMWYTGGVSGTSTDYAIGYATCTGDPTDDANWTKYASNPVLGKGGSGYAGKASRSHVFKVGSTYHIYFGDGTDLCHSTSSDGITWATPTTIITAASVGNGCTQVTNSFVWKEGTSDWRMLVEPVGGATWIDQMAYATSSDGLSWTLQNGGLPLTSLVPAGHYGAGGPAIVKEGSVYHLWYHQSEDPSYLPSNIYHATSSDLVNWTPTTPSPVLTHLGSGTFEYDQTADSSVVVVDGTAYLFYCGANNTTNEGGPWFKIGVATAPAVR